MGKAGTESLFLPSAPCLHCEKEASEIYKNQFQRSAPEKLDIVMMKKASEQRTGEALNRGKQSKLSRKTRDLPRLYYVSLSLFSL